MFGACLVTFYQFKVERRIKCDVFALFPINPIFYWYLEMVLFFVYYLIGIYFARTHISLEVERKNIQNDQSFGRIISKHLRFCRKHLMEFL